MRLSPRALILLACVALLPAARDATAEGFQALYARDAVDVIAVGDSGRVYRTLDGGDNWTERFLGPPYAVLRDVAGRGFTLAAVGDGGAIWTSTDSGGNWTLTTVSGTPSLHALAMPSDVTWYAAGGSGTLLKTTDAGGTWAPLSSGTQATLNALAFSDALHGWAAGNAGTLLTTADGGATWTPVVLGTSNALLSVDQKGASVWVVGAEGTAYRSVDGGSSFAGVNLKLDAHADVSVVSMRSPDTLWIAGGGGFLRLSTNGGATWTFPPHSMHAPITDLTASGPGAWACAGKHRVILRSGDHGASWQFPAGATLTRSWGTLRYPFGGTTRGSTFAINPAYKSTIYCALGSNVLRSRDDGETWASASSFPIGFTKCNAFLVSPRDSNLWLAAVGGGSVSDRVMRSTNAGATWDTTLTYDFGEYGIPLEMDPDHPDTVWFGGELSQTGSPKAPLQRSFDFGHTWASVTSAQFRSPCDLVVVPDSTNIVIVADGVTGGSTLSAIHFKSTDGGLTFTARDTMGYSELPGLACCRLRPSQLVSTCWAFGGVQHSTDYGDKWPTVNTAGQPWGVDISKDDPNVVLFGQYSGTPPFSFLSLDGGATYTAIATPNGFNNSYGLLVRDRATMLAEQGSSGLWKMQFAYAYAPASGTQSVAVVSPNGGESWSPGSTHAIQWNASNVALARVEYRRAPGEPWQGIADVAGYLGSYAWTVPWDGTSQAKVRVYDVWDGAPADSSDAVFSIAAPRLVENPAALDFGVQDSGSQALQPVMLSNGGALTLHVTSIGTATAAYVAGRGSLTLAPGQQDTVGVWFVPTYGGAFDDTLVIVSDDLGRSPMRIPLAGTAVGPIVRLIAPNGGESWAAGTMHSVTWWDTLVTAVDLDYRVHPDSAWVSIAQGIPADPPAYAWTVPGVATGTAVVRVRNASGPPSDASDAAFTLTSALFSATPDTLRLPVTLIGSEAGDAIHVSNPGNAQLTVSSVGAGGSEFWVGRTSLTLAGGASDTVGVFYSPTNEGADTTLVTLAANDPLSPHQVVAIGRGTSTLAVGPPAAAAFALLQNRPNPFMRATVIDYALAREADVSVDVFDLRGHLVARLASGRQAAGVHRVEFGGAGVGTARARLAAGVYFYRLRAGGYEATRRMLLVP